MLPDHDLPLLSAHDVVPELHLDASLPVIYGDQAITTTQTTIHCNIDIFGSIFFMLSRFEEVALADRDARDRFPATASLSFRAGFLDRPIVDEYIELLWSLMKRLWPGLERRRRQGTVKVSCDVDQPFDRIGRDPVMLARVLRHELYLKPRPTIAARRVANFVASPFGSHHFDPFYSFDWYMDQCERAGHRAAFYFIADHSAGAIDGTYEIDEPRILALMRKLAGRGHEIGMHGSYNTYRDAAQIAHERGRLARACEAAGLDEKPLGNRQHYLRWDSAETPDHLEAAGFDYDTTGSFADRPGFRYGTCHPFAMWSWKTLGPLKLRQHPLVIMECSVLADGYLGMGHSQDALDLMKTLKERALRYGGDFTLLWHNSELMRLADRRFFQILLENRA